MRAPSPGRGLPIALAVALALALAGCDLLATEPAESAEPTPFPDPTELRDLPPWQEPAWVDGPDGTRMIWAGSARIEPGVAYRYEALTHCGISSTTFDIDGAFWDVVARAGDRPGEVPPGLGFNFDDGVFVLAGPDQGVWTSQAGIRINLRRGDAGPRATTICY